MERPPQLRGKIVFHTLGSRRTANQATDPSRTLTEPGVNIWILEPPEFESKDRPRESTTKLSQRFHSLTANILPNGAQYEPRSGHY